MKKVMQDDRVVIEVEEHVRGKTLSTTRRVAIPPRQYAILELECDELQADLKINQNHFYNKESQTFGWTVLSYITFQKTKMLM